MKKAAIATAVISLAFAGSVFAADTMKMSGANFDQNKADMIKMLDERSASIQEAKTCVEAAKDATELKACKEKHKYEMKKAREEMKEKRSKGEPSGMTK